MLKQSKFLIITLLSLLFLGCENKSNDFKTQHVEVGTITLKEQTIALQQDLSGRVKAKLVSEVRPQISGIIKDRLFVEGSFVKQGDILYKIDDATYKATFNQAKAALRECKSQFTNCSTKKPKI
ncbi:biotin/lipoyl-binding protein [Aliarcobacter butzleri]|uniref:biotin/lipoyl-binding protein n=1 Tax=Aliarcobacter butzleri TaxID=28197 RepID=UPI003AFAB01B